jgi:hypothetical protein
MYKINHLGTIMRIIDNASIPVDLGNADYQKYLDWIAAGNTAPMDPTPTPTAEQLRYEQSREIVRNIPLWAKWTLQQLLDWWTPRLGDAVIDGFAIPVAVKDFLKTLSNACLNIAKLCIAFRDRLWPELADLQ